MVGFLRRLANSCLWACELMAAWDGTCWNITLAGSSTVISTQFAWMDGVMPFFMRIARNAYFSCRQFGLLFQPPRRRMRLNSISKWSWLSLYVNTYLKGLSDRNNRRWHRSMVDWMEQRKPTQGVFLLPLVSFFPWISVRFLIYSMVFISHDFFFSPGVM